ncbi:lipid A-modifier LpxR family protein [Phenylobacterium sp.]|uniref:lipid A-modifier LpxR family protein n=1 Tax=Phenylobacterium sp. TaxID=1871053 RepID=UPI002FD95A18
MKVSASLAAAMCLGAASAASASGYEVESANAEATRSAFALMDAAFAPQGAASAVDPTFDVTQREAYALGQGPVRWRTGESVAVAPSGAVDTLRVSVGGPLRTPGGLPLNVERGEFDAQAYEVTLTRDWPAAMRFAAGDLNVDVTPRAGVGFASGGGQAEAGATVRLGRNLDNDLENRLNEMGVRDGDAFGDQGRWYLFAAASGRAVGLNMLRNGDGWNQAGWSTDRSSALVGDAHVGVGWRQGPMQASLGYVHREVKGQHMIWGQETKSDQMVALSFSIRAQD